MLRASRIIDMVDRKLTLEHYKNLPRDPPDDLDEFYAQFRPITHPYTFMPVTKLTGYQHKMWNAAIEHKRVLCIKGQKIGMTTLCCLRLIHAAQGICRGQQLLVVGPSMDRARDIMRMIRKLYHRSIYKDFPIYEHIRDIDDDLMEGIRTSDSRIYVRNFDDPSRPTEIIPATMSKSSLSGHREVGFVYASDIGLAGISTKQMQDCYALMSSRLAMSRGPMLIETPPNKAEGPLWELCKDREASAGAGYVRINPELAKSESGFWVCSIPTQLAVDEGAMDQTELNFQMSTSPDAKRYYDACFNMSGTERQDDDLLESYTGA